MVFLSSSSGGHSCENVHMRIFESPKSSLSSPLLDEHREASIRTMYRPGRLSKNRSIVLQLISWLSRHLNRESFLKNVCRRSPPANPIVAGILRMSFDIAQRESKPVRTPVEKVSNEPLKGGGGRFSHPL